MSGKRKYIGYLFLSLWTLIMLHECIPHYHTASNQLVVKFLNQNEDSDSKQSDEDGPLDNLVYLKKDFNPQVLLMPMGLNQHPVAISTIYLLNLCLWGNHQYGVFTATSTPLFYKDLIYRQCALRL